MRKFGDCDRKLPNMAHLVEKGGFDAAGNPLTGVMVMILEEKIRKDATTVTKAIKNLRAEKRANKDKGHDGPRLYSILMPYNLQDLNTRHYNTESGRKGQEEINYGKKGVGIGELENKVIVPICLI